KAIVKRLHALETLSSVNVICADKTGTLTQNRLTVTMLDQVGNRVSVRENLDIADPDPAAEEAKPEMIEGKPDLAVSLVCGALCNDSTIKEVYVDGRRDYSAIGDSVDAAIAIVAAKMGLVKQELEKVFRRVETYPFDSEKMMMVTVHEVKLPEGWTDTNTESKHSDSKESHAKNIAGKKTSKKYSVKAERKTLKMLEYFSELIQNADRAGAEKEGHLGESAQEMKGGAGEIKEKKGGMAKIVFVKGALESVLNASKYIHKEGKIEVMDSLTRQILLSQTEELSAKGQRVLGTAFKIISLNGDGKSATSLGDTDEEEESSLSRYYEESGLVESDLVYAGMITLADPPRTEIIEAIQDLKQAGIRTVILTGDHPLSALHIARLIGIDIIKDASKPDIPLYLTGADIEKMTDEELKDAIQHVSVFARASADIKARVCKAFRENGDVVAITGDGIRDAQSLRAADIGTAMGDSSQYVPAETAAIALPDGNFATLVQAIAEGRRINDNIRRFIRYMLSGNIGEILVMMVGLVAGLPLPLLPLQILWINLITDGLPALALGTEKAEKDVMARKPRPSKEDFFDSTLVFNISWGALLIAGLSLGVGIWYYMMDSSKWQTMIFVSLSLGQLFYALGIRSSKSSILEVGLLSNLPLLGALSTSVLLLFSVVYIPGINTAFAAVPLGIKDIIICFGIGLCVLLALEVEKKVRAGEEAKEEKTYLSYTSEVKS
ncbi:MAG: HAD-IC family P-type ATPase, partial [Thermoplasmata archaeon]